MTFAFLNLQTVATVSRGIVAIQHHLCLLYMSFGVYMLQTCHQKEDCNKECFLRDIAAMFHSPCSNCRLMHYNCLPSNTTPFVLRFNKVCKRPHNRSIVWVMLFLHVHKHRDFFSYNQKHEGLSGKGISNIIKLLLQKLLLNKF